MINYLRDFLSKQCVIIPSFTQSHGHLLVNSIQAFHASAAPELLAKSVISVIPMHWLGEHREHLENDALQIESSPQKNICENHTT